MSFHDHIPLMVRRYIGLLRTNIASWRAEGFQSRDNSIVFAGEAIDGTRDWHWIETPPWETRTVMCGVDVEALHDAGYAFPDHQSYQGLIKGGKDWARAVLVFRDKQLAHASQVSTSAANPNVPGYLMGDASDGDLAVIGPCVTAPQWRGHGLYPAVLSKIVHDVLADGKKRAVIMTRVTNPASARGILKAGFVPWRLNNHFRIGFFDWNRAVPLDPVETEARILERTP